MLMKISIAAEKTAGNLGPIGENRSGSREDRKISAVSLEAEGKRAGNVVAKGWIVDTGRVLKVNEFDLTDVISS